MPKATSPNSVTVRTAREGFSPSGLLSWNDRLFKAHCPDYTGPELKKYTPVSCRVIANVLCSSTYIPDWRRPERGKTKRQLTRS